MKVIRRFLAALLAAGSFQAVAAPADYSDLWWNPQESGWGMNVVQQGETAFVTLFVYGPDERPTWYFASNAAVFAEDASGNPAFRGTLYKTMGPWQGGPFDPSRVSVQAIGDIVIEPREGGKLYVNYFAEGARVVKLVQRQSFSQPDIGSNYHGTFRLRQVRPGSVPHGTREYAPDVLLNLDGANVFMRVEEPLSRCEYRGTRTMSGRFATITGQFTCTGPEGGGPGTFEVSDFEVTQHGISGYLRTYGADTNQYGRFAAARY